MFTSLDLFRSAYAMASHAGTRQAVIARNIANADTPRFRAQDIAPFAEAYDAAGDGSLRASRPGHLFGAAGGTDFQPFTVKDAEVSPNGNSVSLEQEMLKGVEAHRQHERAIAIYRSGLSILRASLGRR